MRRPTVAQSHMSTRTPASAMKKSKKKDLTLREHGQKSGVLSLLVTLSRPTVRKKERSLSVDSNGKRSGFTNDQRKRKLSSNTLL